MRQFLLLKQLIRTISFYRILVIGLLGASLAFVYSIGLLDLTNLSILGISFSVVYLFTLFSLLVYLIIYRWIFPILLKKGYSVKLLSFILVGSLITGIFIVLVIPIKIDLTSLHISNIQNLVIIATGNKNDSSQGREVRLANIFNTDNSQLGFDNLVIVSGNWSEKDGQLMDLSDFPGKLTMDRNINGPIRLVFISHPWSGEVQLIWNGKFQKIDLYSAVATTKEIILVPQIPVLTPIFEPIYISSIGLSVGCIIFFLMAFLIVNMPFAKVQNEPTFKLGNNKTWVLFGIFPFITWSIWLLTYWPGLLSFDFLDQWHEAMTGIIYDAHPAAHTLLIWLISRVYESPGSVAFFQIICLTILVTLIFRRFLELGVNKIILFFFDAIISLSPVNSTVIITIVKDVPYTIAFLWFSWCIFETIASDGKWLGKWRNLIFLGISGGLVSLFRYNGAPVIFVVFFSIAIIFRKYFKFIFIGTIICIFLIIFIRGPIYKFAKVDTVDTKYATIPYFISSYIAAHLEAKTPLTRDEYLFLNQIKDIRNNWNYNPFTTVPINFDTELISGLNHVNTTHLFKVFIDLTLRNPQVTINNLLSMGNMIWEITTPTKGIFNTVVFFLQPDRTVTTIAVPDPYHNGFLQDSKIPMLVYPIANIYTILNKLVGDYLWRPALYLYILIWVCIIYSIKSKNAKWMLVCFPVIIQSIILFLVIPSPDFRYQYPVYLATLIFMPYLLFSPKKTQSISKPEE